MPRLKAMEERIREYLERKQYADAFVLVVGLYQNKVFRLAYSILGNRALAEESAQDIFLRIWRALPGFRGESSMSTWIFAIARNTCFSAAGANAGRRTLSIDEPGVRLAAEARHATAAVADLGDEWSERIAQLPEKYRQAIMLFYMEDKSYAEVAEMLDLPMGTVKTYLHRAKKELAAAMSGSGIKIKGGTG